MVTGHANLKKHLHKMGLSEDAACDRCGLGVEDRDHFVCRCEAYCEVRLVTLGSAFVEPSDLSEIPLRSILEFIKRSGRLDKARRGTHPYSNAELERLKWALTGLISASWLS
jgi:hypothetical protein